jgi:hypothetical protein
VMVGSLLLADLKEELKPTMIKMVKTWSHPPKIRGCVYLGNGLIEHFLILTVFGFDLDVKFCQSIRLCFLFFTTFFFTLYQKQKNQQIFFCRKWNSVLSCLGC